MILLYLLSTLNLSLATNLNDKTMLVQSSYTIKDLSLNKKEVRINTKQELPVIDEKNPIESSGGGSGKVRRCL